MPVYSVENYLEKCIHSISIQKLDLKQFEIIAVNDGSSGGSIDILKRLEKNNTNLIIYNQENKGLSGARNSGLNIAKGKYVLFVDSDDIILPGCLNNLIRLAEKMKLIF